MCNSKLPVRSGLGQVRDQSEDRGQPKFLVAYQEAHGPYRAGWWVLRAHDLEEWDGPFSFAEDVTAMALQREEQYA